MTTLTHSPTVGLETIQRQAFYVLFDGLNDSIEELNSIWESRDEEFAEHTGREEEPTVVELVDAENFHEGHRPSLINAPIDRYPNVAVMAYQATPAPGSEAWDHTNVYRDLLYVDVMARSQTDEGEVNRRIHRMADAVTATLLAKPTLNGVVHQLDSTPTVRISDVFVRKEKSKGHYGNEWYWQGARVEYAVRKEAMSPSSSPAGSIFRNAGYDIDQS